MKTYEAQILEESLAQEVILESYVPGIDNPIAILRDMNNNQEFDDEEVFFYTKDHLGSIRELVGLDGKLKQRQRYTAYGVTTREKNTDQMDRLIDHAYAFTSRELDSETGLHFYRARFYSVSDNIGRFISEDPIGFAGEDVNLYRYVKNNPLGYIDSNGLLRDPRSIFEEALNHPLSSSGTRNRGNAFQHCYASCMMDAENGSLAAFMLGGVFELVNNAFDNQSKEDFAMDTANNKAGRNLSSSCVTPNRTSFNEKKSREISKSCATSCSNSNLVFLDF